MPFLVIERQYQIVYRMLYAVAEMQMFAYIDARFRRSWEIQRFILQSTVFVIYQSEIFDTQTLKSTTPKGMYGAPISFGCMSFADDVQIHISKIFKLRGLKMYIPQMQVAVLLSCHDSYWVPNDKLQNWISSPQTKWSSHLFEWGKFWMFLYFCL